MPCELVVAGVQGMLPHTPYGRHPPPARTPMTRTFVLSPLTTNPSQYIVDALRFRATLIPRTALA